MTHPALSFTPDETALLRRTICKGATEDELALFIGVCKRTGLDPFARQIFMVFRWDKKEQRNVAQIQTSIDGFRVVAQRSGQYAGQLGPFWWHEGSQTWIDVWVAQTPPPAAKVAGLRHDFKEPCWGVAKLESYRQMGRDGSPSGMWGKMPEVMLAKCAEAIALRRAFPQELGGLYTSDEMAQQESAPAQRTAKALIDQAVDDMKRKVVLEPDEIERMLEAFASKAVSKSELENYMGHPISETTLDERAHLQRAYRALSDGLTWEEFIGGPPVPDEESPAPDPVERVRAKIRARKQQQADPEPPVED